MEINKSNKPYKTNIITPIEKIKVINRLLLIYKLLNFLIISNVYSVSK